MRHVLTAAALILANAAALASAQTFYSSNGSTYYGSQPGGYANPPASPNPTPPPPPSNYAPPPPSNYYPDYGQPPALPQQPEQPVLMTTAQLDNLMGRIALYPDALLAQIVMAATTPGEVDDAARWSQFYVGATDEQINAQPWQPAVKSLVRTPQVLQMMAQDLDWTSALGQAYSLQPADVMNAVQRLRFQAQAAGALVSTPQQTVIATPEYIQIVPAQPEVVYVPVYEPSVVYVARPAYDPAPRPVIHFGLGIRIGRGWDFNCDWRERRFITPPHYTPPIYRPYHPPHRPTPPTWYHRDWNHHDNSRRDNNRWDRDHRNDYRRDDNRRDDNRRGDERRGYAEDRKPDVRRDSNKNDTRPPFNANPAGDQRRATNPQLPPAAPRPNPRADSPAQRPPANKGEPKKGGGKKGNDNKGSKRSGR